MIGPDLGPTNCKVVLLDVDRYVKAKAADIYRLRIPQPAWAEQDVRDVWQGVARALREVAASSPVPPQGICLSGAMHSLFPVVDGGTPLANAITWADARATAVHRGRIADADTHAVFLRTGCPVHSTYHLQRLRWWNRHEPEQAESAYLWVAMKDRILRALGLIGAEA